MVDASAESCDPVVDFRIFEISYKEAPDAKKGDAMLDLKEGASKADLLKAMEGHILGQGQLMGRYQRS